MADQTEILIGENSKEGVAYKLFQQVRLAEKPAVHDRKWILDTYAECLITVWSPNSRF